MKAIKFVAVALAALTLVACNKKTEENNGGVEVTKVTLDQATAKVKVGETLKLTATVEPAGAATVVWSSSDEAIATVKDGVVTGIANGRAVIVATAGAKKAQCIVEVGEVEDVDDYPGQKYLDGSEYYVFAMDGQTFGNLEAAGKIKDDFRVDGGYEGETIAPTTHSVLEIWNKDAGDANYPSVSGPNSFGVVEGWVSLNAGSCAWGNICGGFRQVHRTVDLTKVTKDHKLVIIYKTPASNNASADLTFTLYSTYEEGPKVELKANARTAGEWKVLEYSMADLFTKGLDWTKVADVTAGLADGTMAFYTLGITIAGAGQGVEVDGVFVYKK